MNEEYDAMAALTAEKLLHALDLLRAELRERSLITEREMDLLTQRNEHLLHRIKQLEETDADHEARLRSATDGVTQFRVWSGGAGIMSVVAFIKSMFLGG